MLGRAPALLLVMVFAACDGPIRLDVVTAIPPDPPSGGGGIGNTGNTGNTGNETSGGAGGSTEDGGAGGGDGELGGSGGDGSVPPPWEAPTLYQASFAAFALPGEYLRHQNALGFVTPIDPVTVDAEDATFEVIPGMIGESDECFSIRRLGGDYSFMRHANSRIRFAAAHDEPLFLSDATFCFRPGLAEPTWVSFESFNFEGSYIRIVHNATDDTNELFIDEDDGTDLFAAEATFRVENPFQQP